ncbi:MAG: hypothetical protein IT557_08045 [Alphaproteobacteria bacterium]|nr:hypothetical protein [Alphaproteobacteria bacterium]
MSRQSCADRPGRRVLPRLGALGLVAIGLAACAIDTSTDTFPGAYVREAARPARAVANCLQPALTRLRWPVVADELRRPQRRNASDGSITFTVEGFPTFAYRIQVEPNGASAARITAFVGGGAERVFQESPRDVMARLRPVVNGCLAAPTSG